MTENELLENIKTRPESVNFSDVMQVIADNYNYTPCDFSNGGVVNKAGQNEGSCKVFAFAQRHQLNELETLTCFGDYYRQDVLGNPAGEDHANIRSFMKSGWAGVSFSDIVLLKGVQQLNYF